MAAMISVTAVGPSNWAFMATVMAARLELFIDKSQITPEDIPEGVYNGVLEFFDLVMAIAGDQQPQYPSASISAYEIATDALRGSVRPFPEKKRDVVVRLEKYAAFVKGLHRAHKIDDSEELETAKSLRCFFKTLAEDGEDEMYMSTIQPNHPSPGYPSFG